MADAWPLALLAARLTIGVVFAASGLSKLRHTTDVAASVERYQLMPAVLVRPFARLLPLVESGVGGLLLAGTAIPVAAAVAGVLLVGFGTAIGINLARGRQFDCGCSGPVAERAISASMMLRNLALAVAAVAVAATPVAGFGPGGPFGPEGEPQVAGGDGWAVLIMVLVAATTVRLVAVNYRLRRLQDRIGAASQQGLP